MGQVVSDSDKDALRPPPKKKRSWSAPVFFRSKQDSTQNERRLSVIAEVDEINRATPLASNLVSYKHSNSKSVVTAAVKKRSDSLRYAAPKLKRDKSFVKTLVTLNGLALQHSSESCRRDRDIVLAAVTEYKAALQYAHDDLKNDKSFIKLVLSANPWCLEFVEPQWKASKELVMIAVSVDPKSLYYSTDEMKDDPQVIELAIERDGFCLLYASERLKNDVDLVCRAVSNNDIVLYTLGKYKGNKDVMRVAIQKNYRWFFAVTDELQMDKSLAILAIRSEILSCLFREGARNMEDLEVPKVLCEDLLGDEEIIRAMTRHNVQFHVSRFDPLRNVQFLFS